MYRTPLPKNDAILSYVYTNPTMESIVNRDDHLLVFGNPVTVATVMKKFELPLVRKNGKMSLGEEEQPSERRAMPPVKEGDKERESEKESSGRRRTLRSGRIAMGADYKPIQAKQSAFAASHQTPGTGGSSMEVVELVPLKKPQEEQGAASKGWGAILGTKVHPVGKYLSRRLSRSNSPPVTAQMSRDTSDIGTVRKFSMIDGDDDKEKIL
jgi:hypothetical protein